MDFIDRVRAFSARATAVKQRQESVATEQATKNALVMPFLNNVLEYNVFDPTEVVPEFTADVGTKRGEKVDYAVMKDGNPIIIFECKKVGSNLASEQTSQLYRYFSVTTARFGVLTDGIIYRFFTDLEDSNKMESKPFLEFDLSDFDESLVNELKKFSKSAFEIEGILATASDLKYTREIKRILHEQWSNPSDDLVRLFTSWVYSGTKTKAIMEQFKQITKSAFQQYLSDRISDRLKFALADEQTAIQHENTPQEDESQSEYDTGIVTTEDEIQAYYIVKAILRDTVDPKRIYMRDQKSYCGVLLDNSNRKPVCRFYFGPNRKQLVLLDDQRHEQRELLQDIDDIYTHADKLKKSVSQYLTGANQE